MTPAVIWLGWACYVGAAIAIVVFLAHILGSRPHKRLLAAPALIFISLALSQTPHLFQDAYSRVQIARAAVVTACLLATLTLQAYALFRVRAGEEGPTTTPNPAEPPSQVSAE